MLDLRWPLGLLFGLLGLILGGLGLARAPQAAAPSLAGANPDAWVGGAMLAFGALCLALAWAKPASDLEEDA